MRPWCSVTNFRFDHSGAVFIVSFANLKLHFSTVGVSVKGEKGDKGERGKVGLQGPEGPPGKALYVQTGKEVVTIKGQKVRPRFPGLTITPDPMNRLACCWLATLLGIFISEGGFFGQCVCAEFLVCCFILLLLLLLLSIFIFFC